MTEGAWPAGYARYGHAGLRVYQGPRRVHNHHAQRHLLALAAYLTSRRPARQLVTGLVDACLRTHVWFRVYGQVQVHEVAVRGAGYVRTACGLALPLTRGAFTGAGSSCIRPDCARVRSQRKAERPEPVDMPVGPYQGEPAKTTTGVTLPDNSVAIPTGEDSFRSVKSTTDTRANGPTIAGRQQPRQRCEASEPSPPIRRDSRRPLGP